MNFFRENSGNFILIDLYTLHEIPLEGSPIATLFLKEGKIGVVLRLK